MSELYELAVQNDLRSLIKESDKVNAYLHSEDNCQFCKLPIMECDCADKNDMGSGDKI